MPSLNLTARDKVIAIASRAHASRHRHVDRGAAASMQPGRVLVVQGEVRLAETVRRGLLDDGFVVDVAHNGTDGLISATATAYDVVVLDVTLPALSGYEVCRKIRRADTWTPVLMLSTKDEDQDQVYAFDLGADDYLTKPFSLDVLVARLRALVRRRASVRPTVLAAGDLTLYPATGVVRRGADEITLTPRELALLHYLIRRRGDVVSKSEILASAWDDAHHDANVVEVYIGYLRRKIDRPFGRHALQTVRGVGYRLAADGG